MKKIFTNIPNFESIELIDYYDEFSWYYPECEMNTKAWCVENVKDDWVILDCGANIGYYSILFSKLSSNGKVYAFEPTITYEKLCNNIEYNKCENIEPIKLALGDKTGSYTDKIYRIWGNKPEQEKYPFIKLDDFMKQEKLKRVDLIKIDVDSFDFEVLKGSKEILAKFNPIIIVELNHALSKRGQSNIQAMKWLFDLGYKEAIVKDDDNFIFQKNSNIYEKYKTESLKLYIT